MNLSVLLALLLYYGLLSAFFLSFVAYLPGYTTTIDYTSSNVSASEIDKGGVFGTGVDFGRFIAFVAFGIGLPDTVPGWAQAIIFFVQTTITVLTIGFVISSIWNG